MMQTRFPLVLNKEGTKWVRSNKPNPWRLYAAREDAGFETIATSPASSSLQAPQTFTGSRIGYPIVSNVPLRFGQVGEESKFFLGVDIPQQPKPPLEGDCCMSGCAHCVYDVYLDDLQLYNEQIIEAREKVLSIMKEQGKPLSSYAWPTELGQKQFDQTGLNAKEKAEQQFKMAQEKLDPSLRAFLEMEARIKKQQSHRSTSS